MLDKRPESQEKNACTQRRVVLTQADLPLCCPPRIEAVWNAHPRVYLPVEVEGELVCPYCSTIYILKDFTPSER